MPDTAGIHALLDGLQEILFINRLWQYTHHSRSNGVTEVFHGGDVVVHLMIRLAAV